MSTPVVEATAHMSWPDFQSQAADVVSAMAQVGKAVFASGLEHELLELVEVRVSQINGCAFCLSMHVPKARKAGVSQEKLDMLAGWRDADLFTERESAALAWAEALTRLSEARVDEELSTRLAQQFSPREMAHLSAIVGQINFWNRIAAPFGFEPLRQRA
jgi:AhpD family alkylhydroperoxidase